MKSGIRIISETEGIGREISKGDTVVVKLNGWLNKGDSIQKNYVEEIVVGSRKIIAGIDYSLEGMKQGGKRKVKISPHLGYRESGVKGLIPSNAILIYEIEVLTIKGI